MRRSLSVHHKARPSLRALAVVLALACAGPARAEPLPDIQDPHYGDTLFQFFQNRYFSAATTLMVSQHFGRVAHHSDEAEVLRGGILLSYGLHREAGEIFEGLIQRGATPPTRDRAWFYLAKIRYQRGYLNEAENAIARIGNALPPDLQEERGLLQAQLLMARADHAGAAKVLSAMKDDTPGARYVRYNLGIALIKAGENTRGTAVLDALGRAPADTEEDRSLRDRTNVALGFSALTDNQPQAARNYLERVRLKSMESNKALLGMGWAAASLKNPEQALVPWLELGQRDVGDSAVLEAQIAAPYAYAVLGAYGQSARRYNDAIDTFEREHKALGESITEIRAGKLLNALVDRNPGEEMGWFWSVRDLPALPHANHLSQVLAQHDFQEALKNYRDLRYLAKNLEEWRDKLGTFEDMLATRRKAFAERLPNVQQRASEIRITPLRERHVSLATTVAAADSVADGVAFANAREIDFQERLDSVRSTLQSSMENPEFAQARERARLAQGALTWQLAQAYTDRSWQAKRELQAIQDALDTAQKLDAALAKAQREEPARFDVFAQRITAVYPQLQALIPRVAALGNEQGLALQDIAIATLTRQQQRLNDYTTQAQFAVAQLYDRGAAHSPDRADTTKEAGHATKP